MDYQKKTSGNKHRHYFSARIRSFGYAFKGLKTLFSAHPNARIHLFATILVVVFGIFFKIDKFEWALIILCCGLVLAAEAFNSALESLVDLVSPDYHKLAGEAKDLAAAAVLLCAFSAVATGLIIFLPKIYNFF
jgi:diacylglycerol kinase (ATP)